MEAMECIMTRRSIRKYTKKEIPEEDIQKILEAAMFAPSARNLRPWHFIVVDDRSILEKMAEVHPYAKMLLDAPCAIVVCADEKVQENSGYWAQDCSAALQNILLAAHSLGIGSVWLGVHPREERTVGIVKLFGLPEKIKPLGIVSLGYPAEKPSNPQRFETEKIHINKW